jgi:hypothetical protein
MRIYEEDHYSFESETSYIFEYLLPEVFKDSVLKESLLLDTSDPLKSLKSVDP